MHKYHSIISFFIGVMFLVVLQTFSSPQPVFRLLVVGTGIFSLAVWFYNRQYLKSLQKENFWLLMRPILMIWSGLGIFVLLPTPFSRGLFLLVSILVIFISELLVANASENVTLNLLALILFGLMVGIVGIGQYFPPLNSGLTYSFYILAIFFSVYLVSRSFYEFAPQSKNIKQASALILGLFGGELFWALSFLQFHFSAIAILLFNVIYFALVVNYYYYFQTLSFKKIQLNILLLVLTSTLVLLATPWRIIK